MYGRNLPTLERSLLVIRAIRKFLFHAYINYAKYRVLTFKTKSNKTI